MRMNNFSNWITLVLSMILVSFLLLSACSSSKSLTKEPIDVKKPLYPRAEDYYKQEIEYHTFAGRASASYQDAVQQQSFTLQLRMKKDTDIWSSILGMGILEIARAAITPDSLKALIKLPERIAYALSYKEGLNLIKAQVEFPILQNLLIGNPFVMGSKISKSQIKDSLMLVYVEQDGFIQEMHFHLLSGLMLYQKVSHDKKEFVCEQFYSKYAPTTHKQAFAFERKIRIKNKDTQLLLSLDFSRADLDVPVDVRLEIPNSYKRGIIGQ